MLTADTLFIAALAFAIACSLYFAPRIRSDRVAMQWGFDGKPTWSETTFLRIVIPL